MMGCRRDTRISVLASLGFAAMGPGVFSPVAADIEINNVKGYEGMARYAEAAIGRDGARRALLYEKHVAKPFRASCHRELGGYSEAERRLTTPIEDIDALAESVPAIIEFDVESRIIDAIERSARVLPGKDVTVCLFP